MITVGKHLRSGYSVICFQVTNTRFRQMKNLLNLETVLTKIKHLNHFTIASELLHMSCGLIKVFQHSDKQINVQNLFAMSSDF